MSDEWLRNQDSVRTTSRSLPRFADDGVGDIAGHGAGGFEGHV